jgi:hypothetical protein
VNAVSAVKAESGEKATMVGVGYRTPKSTAFDVPPPGVGLTNVTGIRPGAARKEYGTFTTISVDAADVGRIVLVPKFTLDCAMNPDPSMVITSESDDKGDWIGLTFGVMLVIFGAGFEIGGGAVAASPPQLARTRTDKARHIELA